MLKLICLLILSVFISVIAKSENPEAASGRNLYAGLQKTDPIVSAENSQPKTKIIFMGNFYLAPENWSKLEPSDAKLGFGLGGMIGLGLKRENLMLGLGPHFGVNRWQTSFFTSPVPNAFIDLYDMGIEGVFSMLFDRNKISIIFGTGKAQFDSGYSSGGDPNINVGMSKAEEDYTNIGFGWGMGKLNIAPTWVMYSGVAKNVSRFEMRIGIAF